MSNTQYLGTNAGFYYTRTDASTWITYALPVPLREGRPSMQLTQYIADSLDYSRRQVLTVTLSTGTGQGAYEYVGVIRYIDDHALTQSFLEHAIARAGSTAYPLRYTTGLTTGTSSGGMGSGADVWLIEPGPGYTVSMDRQRASFGDLEIPIRVRTATIGGVFSTGSGARWF